MVNFMGDLSHMKSVHMIDFEGDLSHEKDTHVIDLLGDLACHSFFLSSFVAFLGAGRCWLPWRGAARGTWLRQPPLCCLPLPAEAAITPMCTNDLLADPLGIASALVHLCLRGAGPSMR